MVRSSGKSQVAKPHGKKVSVSGKGSITPSSSSEQAKSVKHQQSISVSSCSGCGVVITEDTKALQCDRCQGSGT